MRGFQFVAIESTMGEFVSDKSIRLNGKTARLLGDQGADQRF